MRICWDVRYGPLRMPQICAVTGEPAAGTLQVGPSISVGGPLRFPVSSLILRRLQRNRKIVVGVSVAGPIVGLAVWKVIDLIVPAGAEIAGFVRMPTHQELSSIRMVIGLACAIGVPVIFHSVLGLDNPLYYSQNDFQVSVTVTQPFADALAEMNPGRIWVVAVEPASSFPRTT